MRQDGKSLRRLWVVAAVPLLAAAVDPVPAPVEPSTSPVVSVVPTGTPVAPLVPVEPEAPVEPGVEDVFTDLSTEAGPDPLEQLTLATPIAHRRYQSLFVATSSAI